MRSGPAVPCPSAFPRSPHARTAGSERRSHGCVVGHRPRHAAKHVAWPGAHWPWSPCCPGSGCGGSLAAAPSPLPPNRIGTKADEVRQAPPRPLLLRCCDWPPPAPRVRAATRVCQGACGPAVTRAACAAAAGRRDSPRLPPVLTSCHTCRPCRRCSWRRRLAAFRHLHCHPRSWTRQGEYVRAPPSLQCHTAPAHARSCAPVAWARASGVRGRRGPAGAREGASAVSALPTSCPTRRRAQIPGVVRHVPPAFSSVLALTCVLPCAGCCRPTPWPLRPHHGACPRPRATLGSRRCVVRIMPAALAPMLRPPPPRAALPNLRNLARPAECRGAGGCHRAGEKRPQPPRPKRRLVVFVRTCAHTRACTGMCFFPHATPMDGTGVDSGRCYAAGTGGRRSPYVQAPVPAPPPPPARPPTAACPTSATAAAPALSPGPRDLCRSGGLSTPRVAACGDVWHTAI